MGFIEYWSRRLKGNGVDSEDLVSEGAIGVMLALDRFDPSRGLKFITFAKLFIKNQMFMAIANMGRPVRIPSWAFKQIGKGCFDGETKSYVLNQTMSFDDIVGEDELTLAEILPDNSEDLGESLDAKNRHQLVRDAIASLPEKERSIIYDRFIMGETLQTIASKQGVTKCAIGKKEKKILLKLQASVKRGPAREQIQPVQATIKQQTRANRLS
jgi:RNA polymerase primary sigma factor